ncbi:phosphoribosyltransferase family protein [Ilumatobacter sp.]|uniref:phosphoribosyltransferase family protein n=1 Tax=Ilumatobacter sp. TaxID=1967498 RepID=UPI003751A44C
MADRHTVLFSAEEISATVRDLAASIDRDLGGSRLIVDDIIDTGRTLTELARLIGLQRPRSISTSDG